MSEDAADEVVRIALNGTEVAIRLAGSGAKNLASLLIEWSRNGQKTSGKTNLSKLLASGDTLNVLSLDRETYQKFRSVAKHRVLYSAFSDNRNERKDVDVIFGQRNAALVDYLLGKIGYIPPGHEEDVPLENKKKETPSWDRSVPRKDWTRGNAQTDPAGTHEEKESVIETMHRNLMILRKRREQQEKAPGRSGSRER